MNTETILSRAQLDRIFNQTADAGAERHPHVWLQCNHLAASCITGLCVKVDDKLARTLASLVVLKILDRIRPLGIPESPTNESVKKTLNRLADARIKN